MPHSKFSDRKALDGPAMRPATPLAVENGVGKLAANVRQMPAWERELGELPPPNLSLLDRKVRQGLIVFLNDACRARRLAFRLKGLMLGGDRQTMVALMSPVSPWAALACLIAGLAAASLIAKFFGKPPAQGRFLPIDGLRGLLAFSVFVHHGCVWYYYLRTGDWGLPPSNFYIHLGQSSVALFFMITGFLFFTKLIDGRKNEPDWIRLYVSRALRLTPLYLFAMCLLFLIVAFRSHRGLFDTLPKLFADAARWLSFTIFGMPLLNGVRDTHIITASVTWTLAYEWFFYLSLPLLFLLTGKIPSFFYFAIGLSGMFFLMIIVNLDDMFSLEFFHPDFWKAAPFIGGIAAAVLARFELVRRMAKHRICSFVPILCLLAVLHYETTYVWQPVLILSLAFAVIACGNDMFGSLTHYAARTLGEISYSIYLLHGIVLYMTFHYIIGPKTAVVFSPLVFWLVMVGVVPVLIFISFATFRFIEHPVMRRTNAVSDWVKSRLQPFVDWGQKLRERIYSRGRVMKPATVKSAVEK